MTTKKSYSRYFIILQEEEKGYSLASDKLSSGYAKFEIKNEKCKISYYVQNLKKETSPYHMILICNKKETKRLINLGELNIDDNGRAEVSYEYNVEDIAGSSIGIEKVVGAAIVKFADKDIIPVMVGFITTDTQEDWKRFNVFFIEKSKEVEEVKIQDVVSKVEKEVTDIQSEEEIPINSTPVEIEEKPVMASSNGEEEPKTQNDGAFQQEKPRDEDANNVFDSYEKNIENIKNMEELEEKKNSEIRDFPIGAIGNYFKNIAEGLEEVKDVCKEIKRCKWYKVPIKSKKDLYDVSDYNKYTVIYYPMYNYFNYIKKYEHFMIGYKCDNTGRMKYMIFAIPGIKSIVEQPFQGRSGFVTWIPLVQGEEAEESRGYWLMFYDFRNRTIAIPVKK